jgi:hypothetical protein
MPSLPQTIPYRELVEAAIQAPSPDNNQPWRFNGQRFDCPPQ